MGDQVESLEYAHKQNQELIIKREAEVAALLHELASHRADIKERDDLASGLVTSVYPADHPFVSFCKMPVPFCVHVPQLCC